MRNAVLAVACCCLLTITAAPAMAVKHDWTRFGFNAARSNSSNALAGISGDEVGHLKRQDVTVPGTVDSSPIYLHDVEVMGRTRDVFLATTSYGRSLALAASTGKILWSYTPPSYDALAGGKQYTTSSPVADRKRGYIYAPSPDGRVRKLSVKDGSEVLSQSWPAAITLDASHEKISSALNLSGGYVVATTAGYGGDIPPYQGHVALVDRDSGAVKHVFNSLCSKRHQLMQPETCSESDAGIWARSGAVVVPRSHRLLVATGNGDWNGHTNWGDSVLELSADAMQLLGSWTPTNQASLDSGDVDLGSTAPALLPFGSRLLALQSGKDARMRLLDVDNLNGHGHACACKGGELQTLSAPGGRGVYTAPAVWRSDGKSWAFVANSGATAGYRLDGTNSAKLTRVWGHGIPGTSPVIAGGLLYVYDPSGGGVAVYTPASGKRVGVLPATRGHWNSPIVADERVAIPVGGANFHLTSGTITIYRKP